jgi:predicted PurR-regulated permease PerM
MNPALASPPDHQPAAATAGATVVPAIRMPVDARGLALATLAVIAVVFALDWAQAFLVSLLLGIVLAYTLNPLVAGLERVRIPRALASLVVMSSVLGALALGGYSLRGQMQTIVEQLPAAASSISSGLARLRTSQLGNMQKMQSGARQGSCRLGHAANAV